jgi:hypothetical protein
MKLDKDLEAAVAAQINRQKVPLWSSEMTESAARGTAQQSEGLPASESGPRVQAMARGTVQDGSTPEILSHLNTLQRAVETLIELVKSQHPTNEDVPHWLRAAAKNPQAYDEPDPTRTGVYVRLLPPTYQRFHMAHRRLNFERRQRLGKSWSGSASQHSNDCRRDSKELALLSTTVSARERQACRLRPDAGVEASE